MNRWLPFALSAVASIAITVGLWAAGIPALVFFLLGVPFLFLPRYSSTGDDRCVECQRHVPPGGGWRFCPACGAKLP